MTEVRLRPLAEQDLIKQAQYHVGELGTALGERFFEAASQALSVVGERPEGGSLRIGELCEIEGLRVRRVDGFRCGWFYFTRPEFIDVARLLGYAQDLPFELDELT